MCGKEIRPLTGDEFHEATLIAINAFPATNVQTQAEVEQAVERTRRRNNDPEIGMHGLFDESGLQGVMRFHDFQMRLHGADLLVGGLGGVAVDLLHKKERVAFEMVQYYLQHFRDKGAPLAALYPFRPDFYKKMGFGFGGQINQFRLLPARLPKGGDKRRVRFLSELDKEAFQQCYEAYRQQTNGLMHKTGFELDLAFETPRLKLVGFEADGVAGGNGRLLGYAGFQFKRGNSESFLSNHIEILEFAYLNPEALMGLLSFFRSQADQVERIIINTMLDDFYMLTDEPRTGSGNMFAGLFHETGRHGAGIMYRVLDVNRLFFELREVNFGGQSCVVELQLQDSFLPENEGSYLLRFEQGRVSIENDDGSGKTAVSDAILSLDISEFSSLIIGAVSPKTLYDFGLLQLDKPSFLPTLQTLFSTLQKPICFSRF